LTADEQQQLEEALNVLLEEVRANRSRSSKAMRKIFIAGWKVS
jgi:thioredoxin-like negative regulator of GroEL